MIERLAKDPAPIRFHLDAGNLYATKGSLAERSRIDGTIADALSRMDLDFVNPTPSDLEQQREGATPGGSAFGVPFWESFAREDVALSVLALGELPDLDSPAAEALLAAVTDHPVPRASLRVGLAVVDESYAKTLGKDERVGTYSSKTRSVVRSEDALGEDGQPCDASPDPLEVTNDPLGAWIGRLPSLDVLILSCGDTHHRNAVEVGSTLVVFAPAEGQYLGRVAVFPDGRAQEEWLSLFGPSLTDPEIAALVSDMNDDLQAIRKLQAKERDDIVKDLRWVGGDVCASCHEEEARVWDGTGHAHAMETLVDANKDFDPDCLSCHVTAWEDGYVDPLTTPELGDVQCEACHGPGREHASDPEQAMGNVADTRCLVCHTEANSPEFDSAAYHERIRHW